MADPSTTPNPESLREIARRVLEQIWGEGRLELVDELYAPDYVDHVAKGPEPAQVQGPEALKEAVRSFRRAFPDLSYRADAVIVEGDVSVARFSATGTHRGPFLGLEPTGTPIAYAGIDINRVRDGLIVESWVQYDALGLLQQLGLVPEVPGT